MDHLQQHRCSQNDYREFLGSLTSVSGGLDHALIVPSTMISEMISSLPDDE